MIVWLASYPRSGNTFFRVILNSIFNIKTYSIYNDKADIGADEGTSKIVGHISLPDDFDLSQARNEEKCYFIKTHELPDERVVEHDRVIYLIRDGRESVFSYERYLEKFTDRIRTSKDVIYGNVFSGGWGDHVNSWQPNERDNTLLIKFEDLVDSPNSFIKEISDFIGVVPEKKHIPAFEELQKINKGFFNSGKKDSWKQVYSEDQHVAFWMKNYEQMIAYGYNLDVPEMFDLEPLSILFRQVSAENSYALKQVLSFQRIINEKSNALRNKKIIIKELEEKVHELQVKLEQQIAYEDEFIQINNNNRIVVSSINKENSELKKKLYELTNSKKQRFVKKVFSPVVKTISSYSPKSIRGVLKKIYHRFFLRNY